MTREETTWGVRLLDNPFNDERFIQADITRGKRLDIKVYFSGTTPHSARCGLATS